MAGRLAHLVRRRIATKLTLTLVGFTLVAVLAGGLYLDRALETLAVEALEAQLSTVARVLHDGARRAMAGGDRDGALRDYVVRTARTSGMRVSVVAADGRVVADSEVAPADVARLENHGQRPEVRAALAGRVGRDVHASSVGGASMLYVAVPLRDGVQTLGVLRVALPVATITASHGAVQRALLAGGLVAVAAALGMGLFIARRVTRPVVVMQAVAREMSAGNFAARAPIRSPDEIGALGHALNAMAASLRDKLDALEHERAKLAAILDGMVEGVTAVDGRDQVVLLNGPARAMFGLGPGRGEGRAFLEVIRNADLHQVFREAREAGEGTVTRRELRLEAARGRDLGVNAVPLRLGGDGIGVVMVLHDITELRRLEQVRTEFVANVSHELRTPLTAIHGYIETLLGGALEEREDARRFLEIVHRHTERLGRLVSDLTDLSNIELGRVALRLAPTAVDEVVESVVAIMTPQADRGRVALHVAMARDVPRVQADRDRLVQVLLNLVDNAVKYTPPGGRVTIGARVLDPGRLELGVEDTGVGIPPADLPRITERFYRVDRARSRELGGTGLGLAIVKHLVMAHGGELGIDSAPGVGTTVRFTLPVAGAR